MWQQTGSAKTSCLVRSVGSSQCDQPRRQITECLASADQTMLGAGNFIDGFSPIRHSSGESGNSGEPISGARRITGAKEDWSRQTARLSIVSTNDGSFLPNICDHGHEDVPACNSSQNVFRSTNSVKIRRSRKCRHRLS